MTAEKQDMKEKVNKKGKVQEEERWEMIVIRKITKETNKKGKQNGLSGWKIKSERKMSFLGTKRGRRRRGKNTKRTK